MWLLGVDDYKLVHVLSPEETPYAILSHTWGPGEVTFDDIQCLDVARTRPAWDKVQQTCRITRERGLSFVWIDTCCIDKRSSAELSEAINSMFAWYRGAAECYVYLVDYDDATDDRDLTNMGRCRWFTRGWTLQELIAPKLLLFFDCTWSLRGDKNSLYAPLSRITNIGRRVLDNSEDIFAIPVAKRMSWAARRQTTRPEDLAYCLLGIFGVNMPLIYGEGTNAFVRLQEAIALATEDLSLFAWLEPDTSDAEAPRYSGILARSPSQFARCHDLSNTKDPLDYYESGSFIMVNHCFRFQTYLMTDTRNGDYLLPLHCSTGNPHWWFMIVLRLIKTGTGFVRHKLDQITTVNTLSMKMDPASWDSHPRTLTIPKVLRHADLDSIRCRFHGAFHFRVSICGDWEYKLSATIPNLGMENSSGTNWDASTGRYTANNNGDFAGMLTGTVYEKREFGPEKHAQFLVFFGDSPYWTVNDDYHTTWQLSPWIALSRSDAHSPIEMFNPKTVHVFDLPGNVLAQQDRMDYLRFTSYAGNFYQKEIRGVQNDDSLKTSVDRDWADEGGRAIHHERRLRTGLPYAALDMAIFARLETLRVGGYTTHRVHITIQRLSDMPPLQQTVHVFDADGQPHTLPEHHDDPDCPRDDDSRPPDASPPEPSPEQPLGPQAGHPAPPNPQEPVPTVATPDSPQEQAPRTDTTTTRTIQTSSPSPPSALPLPLRPLPSPPAPDTHPPPPNLSTPSRPTPPTGIEKDELD